MPNLVFRDGFDTYNGTSSTATGLASKWTITDQPALVTGRFGTGQALQVTSSAGDLYTPLFTALSSFTVECGLRVAGGSTTSTLRFRTGTTIHLDFSFAADGTISVKRNGTLLHATAPGAFTLTTWYSAQFEVVISDTVGRVSIYFDGVQKVNITNQDTANGATLTVNNVQCFGAGTSVQFDDLIVTDSATRLSNPIRASTLYPTSDGGTLNLVPSTGTSHFALVDEALASATDYLSGSNVGDLDLLGLGNLAATPLSIQEVNVIGYASKTDATSRSYALGVKSGATTSDGSNIALSSSGGRAERPLAVDPNTGSAWTAAAVNALELQPKVTV
jgi:hypothetical protein